jgi:dolichol-phosphate mannosyltransferase
VEKLLNQLARFGLSQQFIKFCIVGFTGVFVNLLSLKLFMSLGVVSTLASALSIQVSIISNFLFHDSWTFEQQKQTQSFLKRILSFELVSLVGATIQWLIFIGMNLLWVKFNMLDEKKMYLSQLMGIIIATGWNFLANLRFTWAKTKS